MSKFGIIFVSIMMATTVYAMICVSIDPDWMFGQNPLKKDIQETEAEVIETTTEVPEMGQIQRETVHFEVVMGKPADIEGIYPQTTAEDDEKEIVVYTIDGCELDSELYEYLRVTMSSMGLEWYLPYALCQIFQESSFNPYAEASNGQDKGLLQYRLKYWNEEDGDIYDPYAQIRVYCRTMHDKVREGLGICQIISDHYTGGVGYDADYVNDVVRWMNYVSIK